MRPAIKPILLFALVLILFYFSPAGIVSSQAGSAVDLINEVNKLRQSQGLAPYNVDSFLMNYAQSHSDYMALNKTWSHTRGDGTTAFQQAIKENIAVGSNMSVQMAIYTIWADQTHWHPMVGYQDGKVGAGVSVADGIVYYILNVLPGAQVANVQPAVLAQELPTNTPTPAYTSTPNEEGAIIHIVKSDDSLWSISQLYGVSISEILENSGLPPTKTDINVGDELIIVPAEVPTITPTITETPEPGTPTPAQPRPTMTPLPTRTPGPTLTPTILPSFIVQTLGNASTVGFSLILASGLGLILVIYLGFLKKS